MDGNISRLRADFEAALPGLSKAVLSQPVDELADAKVVIRPVMLRAGRCYQVERFRGGKAFHQNLGADELLRMFSGELDGRYRQALIASDDGCAQYVLRAKGGYKRTSHAPARRSRTTGKSAISLPRGRISPRWLTSAFLRLICASSRPSTISISR